MPISQKIIDEINCNSEWSSEFKKTLIMILNSEETVHRYKKEFEKIVDEYIEKNGVEINDTNTED